jgi:hypothetical protein
LQVASHQERSYRQKKNNDGKKNGEDGFEYFHTLAFNDF